VDGDVVREAGAQNVLAQKPLLIGFFDRALEDARAVEELPTNVDVGGPALQRVGGDDLAFEHLVGVFFHEQAVLERPRLRFVRVAEQIDRLPLRVLRDEAPLDSRRKPRSAAATQPGFLHLFGDRLRSPPAGQDFSESLVPPVGDVRVDRLRPFASPACEEYRLESHGRVPMRASSFAASIGSW
jgi:hypothetical protein